MNELERLDLIKQGNSLLEDGVITAEEFESFKKTTLSESAVTPSLSFDDLKLIKGYLDKDLIDEEDFAKIKKSVFEGKKAAGPDVIASLEGVRKYAGEGVLSNDDYKVLKDMTLRYATMGKANLLSTQLEHLKDYYSFHKDRIIDEEDFNKYKNLLLNDKTISPADSLNILRKYKKLLDDGVISEDDYIGIKGKVLSHKTGTWMEETNDLLELNKALKNELISTAEYENIKNRFFSGKKIQKKDVFDTLAKYKALVDKGIISNEDYALFKNNILNAKPVKTVEDVEALAEYKKLLDQGVINKEDYDKYKQGVLPVGGSDSQESADRKKKKKRNIIIAAVCAIIALVGIGFLSTLPERNAKKEVAEYMASYEEKIATGDYQAVNEETKSLLEKNEKYLSDEEKASMTSLADYALLLDQLDFKQTVPKEAPLYGEIIAFKDDYSYGIGNTLVDFVEDNFDNSGSIEGTVIVQPKKESESGDDKVSAVEMNSIFTQTASTRRSASGSGKRSSGSATYNPNENSDSSSDEAEDKEKEEEKPKEYPCTGEVFLGFDKVDPDGLVSDSNIKKAYALHVSLGDELADVLTCRAFSGIIYEDELTEFNLLGDYDKSMTVKGSFDGNTWSLDFGNGITATLKKPQQTYTSGSSGSYGSSGSSGSSSSKKDYSEGSEWEQYDKDNDGRINDNEFQDATNDYMDDYFNNNSSNSDYSPGSDWEQYDSNYDGKINDSEFQNAVGDWMDSNGY